jgi:hypothetical protein
MKILVTLNTTNPNNRETKINAINYELQLKEAKISYRGSDDLSTGGAIKQPKAYVWLTELPDDKVHSLYAAINKHLAPGITVTVESRLPLIQLP